MNTIHVYSKRQSRKVARALRMMGLRVLGTVAESAVLPTSELLLLVRDKQGLYSLHLIGGSRLLPLLTIAEDVTEAQAPFIIPTTARRMMGRGNVINFQPTSEDLREDINLLLAV